MQLFAPFCVTATFTLKPFSTIVRRHFQRQQEQLAGHELVAALAPRGLFVNAPLRDANFRWRSVDRVISAARPVHALLGSEALLVVEHPDCEHDFPTAQREQAYAWMQRVLQRAISTP